MCFSVLTKNPGAWNIEHVKHAFQDDAQCRRRAQFDMPLQ